TGGGGGGRPNPVSRASAAVSKSDENGEPGIRAALLSNRRSTDGPALPDAALHRDGTAAFPAQNRCKHSPQDESNLAGPPDCWRGRAVVASMKADSLPPSKGAPN